jgi:charged multivesicular body protein 7
MKSYELSTATLKSILAHPSLERGNIDKTMDALAEANTDAKEIDDAVRIAGDVAIGVSENIDDSEVEAEWEALVKEMAGNGKQRPVDGEQWRQLDQANVPTYLPQPEKEKYQERLPVAA